MRSLGSLGLALSIAALATTASATPDSRMPPPADGRDAADTPVQPDGRAGPPPHGGWGREGWSDDGAGPGPGAAMRMDDGAPGPRADMPRADMPPGPPPRDGRMTDIRRAAPRGEWRRETWDGGRGDAFAYRRGGRLPAIFASPRYAVPDWAAWSLPRPGARGRWVRYYDDAVLIDARGRVIDAVPAIGWDDDRRGDRRGPGHDGPWGDGRAWGDGPWIEHRGPGPAPEVHRGPGGLTTIVIRTAPSVTTTTTTTTESYVTTSRRRVWKPQPTRLVQTKPHRTVQTKLRRTVQTKPNR